MLIELKDEIFYEFGLGQLIRADTCYQYRFEKKLNKRLSINLDRKKLPLPTSHSHNGPQKR
jgi:hypothetical protein